MDKEFTNLLPPARQKVLQQRYHLRFFVVCMLAITILILSSAVLLLPTYVFLSKSVATKQAYLASLEAANPSVNEKEISKRLASLTANANLLATLAHARAVSTFTGAILAVPHVGIGLIGFAYTPPKQGTKTPSAAVYTVSGTAATRDTLRSYQLALQGVPSVSAAALPVSAYAQSSDIPFTITLTLSP